MIYRFYEEFGEKRELIIDIDEKDDTKIEYILDNFRNDDRTISAALLNEFRSEIANVGYKILVKPNETKFDINWGF